MDWIKDSVPDMNVNNFTSDWKDGKAIGCLVDSKAPGLCPGWKDWDTKDPVENAKHAMDLAETWLDVQKLLTPEEMVNPNIDEQSMMTYLSQFPNSTLKPGAPLKKPNNSLHIVKPQIMRYHKAYGPGIEANGVMVNEKATFSVEDITSSDGKLEVQVIDSTGAELPCSVDKKLSKEENGVGSTIYNCSYIAKEEGEIKINILFSGGKSIRNLSSNQKFLYHVKVEGVKPKAPKQLIKDPNMNTEGISKYSFYIHIDYTN